MIDMSFGVFFKMVFKEVDQFYEIFLLIFLLKVFGPEVPKFLHFFPLKYNPCRYSKPLPSSCGYPSISKNKSPSSGLVVCKNLFLYQDLELYISFTSFSFLFLKLSLRYSVFKSLFVNLDFNFFRICRG